MEIPRRSITIAGDIGSGKTTVGTLLARKLELEYVSTGSIQRSIAASQGRTTLELNQSSEADPAVDVGIDDFLRQLNLQGKALVVESRLGWHFIPTSIKVYLYCAGEIAARRLVAAGRPDEAYENAEIAFEKMRLRRASEDKRFRRLYGVDIENLRNYDIVLDTSFVEPEGAADLLRRQLDKSMPTAWIAPPNLLPTQEIRSLDEAKIRRLTNDILTHGKAWDAGVTVFFVAGRFFVCDGHNRVAAALRCGLPVISCIVVALDDEPFNRGISARQYVIDAYSKSLAYDWEDANGFRFDFDVGELLPKDRRGVH